MGLHVKRTGFIDNQKMWASIFADMKGNGFTAVSVDGKEGAMIQPDITSVSTFVVDAAAGVDPIVADQPWRFCAKVTADSTRLYAATKNQISNLGEVSVLNVPNPEVTTNGGPFKVESGAIGTYVVNTGVASGVEADLGRFFYHRGKLDAAGKVVTLPGSMVFHERYRSGGYTVPESDPPIFTAVPKDFLDVDYSGPITMKALTDPNEKRKSYNAALQYADYSATPMSYVLSISDHGIALATWIEGRDEDGCRFNWFVIQRAINKDGTVVKDGLAPLFCVSSSNGGGSETASFLDPRGIQRFTVREADMNAPSVPVSATVHSADASAVINPLQQTCLSETGEYDFKLMQGLSTHRHSYAYEIDMVGYSSADVISHDTDLQVQVYNEVDAESNPKKRTYHALNANGPKNTGMRIYLLKSGGGGM